jgi:cation:H+ antiporter
MLTYFLFIIGFVILIKGADLLVEGASSIAKRLHISDIVIGLTIVALGTSAPEFVVNGLASYYGKADLAISNIIGSNIANTFLALGLAAITANLVVKKDTFKKEIPISLVAAIMVLFLANDQWINALRIPTISRYEGIIFIVCFLLFMRYTYRLAKKERDILDVPDTIRPLGISILFIILGLLGLGFGGDWIVDGAIKIARQLGMTESLIGLSIVAIGTSFPEIVTCVVAAKKGKTDLAIGNAVGSNIFNVFWVLGLSAIVRPLEFNLASNFDVIINIFSSLLLLFFILAWNKERTIKRYHGIIFIVFYVLYLGYSIKKGLLVG